MTEKLEISTRYGPAGSPMPDPETMCNGQCEGTGKVPIPADETSPEWKTLWVEAEKKSPSDDGWHFVDCPTCGGTGKEKRVEILEKTIIGWLEALGYAFNDVDLSYEDEEAKEQVECVYKELKQFAEDAGIDWISALKKTGALADPEDS